MAATAIPGMGITTTDALIIAPPTIQVITMATATTVAIIATIIGTTMINRRLMRYRVDSWPQLQQKAVSFLPVWSDAQIKAPRVCQTQLLSAQSLVCSAVLV